MKMDIVTKVKRKTSEKGSFAKVPYNGYANDFNAKDYISGKVWTLSGIEYWDL